MGKSASGKYLKITVVTPCYNSGKYLEETIKSVVDQQYPNLEYIIIDGGSNDGSVAWIKKYESAISYWTSEHDHGVYDALNKGFQKSSGEIMGWLNAGDILMPKSLFFLNELFIRHDNINWIQGQPLLLSDRGYVMHNSPHYGVEFDYLLKKYRTGYHFIQQESTYWRRPLWEKAGGHLNSRLKLAGDFDLWMRFFQHANLLHTKGLIGAFRIHEGQLSENADAYFEECDQVVDQLLQNTENKNQLKAYRRWVRISRIPWVRKVIWNKMNTQRRRSYSIQFIQ
ncbi:MAG: glycosyltransferase family 2 protein [Bacteroidota bacterium]